MVVLLLGWGGWNCLSFSLSLFFPLKYIHCSGEKILLTKTWWLVRSKQPLHSLKTQTTNPLVFFPHLFPPFTFLPWVYIIKSPLFWKKRCRITGQELCFMNFLLPRFSTETGTQRCNINVCWSFPCWKNIVLQNIPSAVAYSSIYTS